MQGKKKNILHILFLFFLIAVTFYVLLKDQDIEGMFLTLQKANPFFVFLAILVGLSRLYGEAVSIQMVYRSLGEKTSFLQCFWYAAVGFLFCGITPSASGGQPAQLFYMKRDKHTLANSSLCLVLLTILSRATMVFFGVILFALYKLEIYRNLGKVKILFAIGLFMNGILFVGFFLVLCGGGVLRKVLKKCIQKLAKWKIIKNQQETLDNTFRVIAQYEEGAIYLKNHVALIVQLFLINVVQRCLMFVVPYFIYRAWGLEGHSALKILLLQSVVSICTDMLPLPGGVFVNEQCYLIVMLPIFHEEYIYPSMLLSRGISFYFLLLFSVVILVFMELFRLVKEKKRNHQHT